MCAERGWLLRETRIRRRELERASARGGLSEMTLDRARSALVDLEHAIEQTDTALALLDLPEEVAGPVYRAVFCLMQARGAFPDTMTEEALELKFRAETARADRAEAASNAKATQAAERWSAVDAIIRDHLDRLTSSRLSASAIAARVAPAVGEALGHEGELLAEFCRKPPATLRKRVGVLLKARKAPSD